MPEEQTINRSEVLALMSEIVAAHISNNLIAEDNLSQLIQAVFDTLNALASDEPAPVELTPAVPIKRSVT
ncbi:MAG TPA: MucR family transcriptional regulator, partial [Vicinamibacterales bacterium]|nr:MucR family transcriptional regulator [Vicinamibacterales bacterium]